MDRERKNLVVFGYGLVVISLVAATRLVAKHGWNFWAVILLSAATVLIFLTRFKFGALRPLYAGWMKVAHLIGTVFTAVVLSVLYYFVFGIVGIFLRLFQKDLLDRRIDRSALTYWAKKDSAGFNKENYLRQF